MTIDDFLEELKKTPRNWRLETYGHIRLYGSNNRCDCPITAVCGGPYGQMPGHADSAGAKLGLQRIDREAIIMAADSNPVAPPGLRDRILGACSLI